MAPKQPAELSSGFTWRVVFVIFLTAMVFIPVSTYASLVLGSTVIGGVASLFMTLLIFKLAQLFGQRLSPQETLLLYYGTGVGGAAFSFMGLIIYRVYYIHSPFAWSATIDGTPIALLVPEWMAPRYGSPAYAVRSIFQLEYLPAITFYVVNSSLAFLADLALALLISQIYVQFEKLEFPFAKVDTALVSFISQRRTDVAKVFFIGFLIGAAYGAVAFLLPAAIGYYIIPFPFVDLTILVMQNILPGAVLGLPTTLSAYFGGFMVPFNAALYVFIVSFLLNAMNSLFATTFTNVFPEWSREYFKGMGAIAITSRVTARVWFAPTVGFAIGSAIYLLFKSRRSVIRLLRAMLKARGSYISGFPSIRTSFLLFLGAALTSVGIFHYLVPGVPLWVPLLSTTVLSLFVAVVCTASQGAVGYAPPGFPGWLWHTLVYLTPYRGYAGFTAPPLMSGIVGVSSANFSQQVKAALSIRLKPGDLIKLWIYTTVLSTILAPIWANYFWTIAPIPSSAYPATVYSMPSTASTDTILVARQLRASLPYILVPMLCSAGVLFLGELFTKVGIAWSSYGFVLGLFYGFIPATAMFIGSLLGRTLMPRLVGGKQHWDSIKQFIVAGEGLGEGFALVISVILGIMSKSAWLWPW